ncbi:MAG TPA: glycosyltransferase [bacterium]|nr:glycosyltransferase [bacterium]
MSSNGPPLVSIVIPAYNASAYVGRAIKTALSQTHQRIEIIVVDDGSRDNTGEVVRSFRDSRITYIAQENRGQGAARNRGIRISSGKYVTFLDADDCYFPRKVEREVELLETHPDYQVVFCDALHYYPNRPDRLRGRRYYGDPRSVFAELLRSSFINPNTIMAVGDILRGEFLFREERYYPEEWDLCLRLARAGVRFAHLDEALVVVEIRRGSNTRMDIQWILKRHTLEMFERLFAQMDEAERGACAAAGILRRCKLRLAAAYLASEDPAQVDGLLADLFPPLVARAVRTGLRMIPARMIRVSARAVWTLRQRFRLPPWRDAAVGRAWGELMRDCL